MRLEGFPASPIDAILARHTLFVRSRGYDLRVYGLRVSGLGNGVVDFGFGV